MRYDVIVLGQNFAAHAAAGFLAQQGQKVAVFTLGEPFDGSAHAVRLVDRHRHHYRFMMPADNFGALGEGELFARYLNHLGLDDKLPVVPNKTARIVRSDGRIIRRDHGFEGFRITLVRHYPQSKAAIDQFFTEMAGHYQDYLTQRTQRLLSKPHTLNTLTSYFGSANLETVLTQYFDDPALRAEFGTLYTVAGLPLKAIRAVDYFTHWFAVMGTASYFLRATHAQLIERLVADQDYEQIDTPLKAIETEGNRLRAIEMTDGAVHSAQQFLIAIPPETFVMHYVTQEKGFVSEKIAPPFRGRPVTEMRGTAYVGIETTAASLGIDTVQTFFETAPEHANQVLIITDQTQLDAKAAPKGHGALQVEYVCHTPVDEAQFMAMLSKKIPHIEAVIAKVKFGPLVPYRGGHHPYYERQKSLRLLDRLDRFNHLKVFDNSWFIGPFHTPEGGLLAQLMVGVEVGNLLRSSLDMPASIGASIPVEMLIAIAAERLDRNVTASWTKTVAWRIGPRFCTWAFYEGDLTLYHGLGDETPDVSLSCGLETFVQWVAGIRTTEDLLARDAIGLKGDVSCAQAFLEAFVAEPLSLKQPHRVLGRVSLLLSIILFIAALWWQTHGQTPYVPALLVSGLVAKGLAQSFVFKKPPWLDGGMAALVLLLWGLQPIVSNISAWVTLSLMIGLLVSFFLPKLGAWPYWAIDHPLADTRWFGKAMGGLNLVYACLLAPLVVGLFLATDMQAFLGIHAIILGAVLTRNYPALYARSRIKRRT
ncbi:MAG: hypothetical protein EA374_04305 [Acholeplasmatales bacterium]|nr:MAG: hypothetical protein EA374_04305 [Acholeplasmatales bacterium]